MKTNRHASKILACASELVAAQTHARAPERASELVAARAPERASELVAARTRARKPARSPGSRRRVAGLLIVLAAFAGASYRAAFSEKAPVAKSQSLLWEVRSETGRAYLLGSIHVGNQSFYPLNETISKAFEESQALAVEADAKSADQAELQKFVMKHGMYGANESLQNEISEKTYEKLEVACRDLGVSVEGFNRMRPWMAALSVSMMRLMKKNYNPSLGIDEHFLARARGKKPILELESAEMQIRLFAEMPHETQLFFLESALTEDTSEKDMELIMAAWKTGDAEALEKILFAQYRNRPEFQPLLKLLYFDRNEKMARKIEEYLKASPARTVFVVVGAGHMVGPEGIPSLLAKKGLTVRRL